MTAGEWTAAKCARRLESRSSQEKWGCALDLTTLDDEGNPWDFNLPTQRAKDTKLLDEEKPLMLITCPM